MSKLFVTDLDGTLLSKDHRISELDNKALQMLVEHGYEIAFCSGRILSSIKSIGMPLGFVDYYIANNGAVVSRNDEVIYDKPLDYSKLKRIVNLVEEKGIGYHMYDLDTYYSNVFEPERLSHLKLDGKEAYQVKVECGPDIIDKIINDGISIYKLSLHMSFAKDPETYKEINSLGGLALYMSGNMTADIMSEGISKGQAVKNFQDKIGKKYDKIVAIGDHQNDIDMIELADIGIAMGNAIDELKAASDFVTDANDNDGFYKAVKYIIEGEK